MIPSKHSRSLYFTPRTPWGRFPQNRPAQSQNYLRASQDEPAIPSPDEKHKLWGKELQGLGAGMATEKSGWRGGAERTLDKNGVPRSLSGQITPERAAQMNGPQSMLPAYAPQSSQSAFPSQSPPQRPAQPQGPSVQQLATQDSPQSTQQQWRGTSPVSYRDTRREKHWSGSIGGDGVRGPKDGADLTQGVIQYSTSPSVKEADNRKQQHIRPSAKTPEQIDQKEFDEAKDPEDFDED